MQKGKKRKLRPAQHQRKPGVESTMKPEPVYDNPEVRGNGKLKDKVAFITGGDSGIGRAIAVLFAKEGADVVIVYLSEHGDAKDTKAIVEETYGRQCYLIPGDVSKESFCISAAKRAIKKFGRVDVLVNNAGVHFEADTLTELKTDNLLTTFKTNIFSFFWLTKALLPYMADGSSIINTASVTAYRGSWHLLDYSATKGAVISFTRSLSANLADKGIRVNAVAPGPIWTPLILSSFKPGDVATFGSDTPLKRHGEPVEVAPCYLFLACNEDSSYITGQVLHPNGGDIING
ncbi:MAG: yhdF [Flavipsychrobacter sp.]|jgi:NAD(P)-dependent dehydrogenase (short-subunit alcohol dehydrogenase family)|nr:yhdF [Flavipsychrobacter sp.]